MSSTVAVRTTHTEQKHGIGRSRAFHRVLSCVSRQSPRRCQPSRKKHGGAFIRALTSTSPFAGYKQILVRSSALQDLNGRILLDEKPRSRAHVERSTKTWERRTPMHRPFRRAWHGDAIISGGRIDMMAHAVLPSRRRAERDMHALHGGAPGRPHGHEEGNGRVFCWVPPVRRPAARRAVGCGFRRARGRGSGGRPAGRASQESYRLHGCHRPPAAAAPRGFSLRWSVMDRIMHSELAGR